MISVAQRAKLTSTPDIKLNSLIEEKRRNNVGHSTLTYYNDKEGIFESTTEDDTGLRRKESFATKLGSTTNSLPFNRTTDQLLKNMVKYTEARDMWNKKAEEFRNKYYGNRLQTKYKLVQPFSSHKPFKFVTSSEEDGKGLTEAKSVKSTTSNARNHPAIFLKTPENKTLDEKQIMASMVASKHRRIQTSSSRQIGSVQKLNSQTEQPIRVIHLKNSKVAPKKIPNSLEGLEITKYNRILIADKSFQEYILSDKLKVIVYKAFNLINLLNKGLKLKIKDVISQIPVSNQRSFNLKIRNLCLCLYKAENILWKDIKENKKEIECFDISDTIKRIAKRKNGKQHLDRNIKDFPQVAEHFRFSVDAYKIIVKREDIKPFTYEEIERLIYLVEKCRFIETNIEEEYKIYENSIDSSEQLSRKKEFFQKRSKLLQNLTDSASKKISVFQRLTSAKSSLSPNSVNDQDTKVDSTEKNKVSSLLNDLTEEEKLNEYIHNCLHKIHPVRKQNKSGLEFLWKSERGYLDQITKDQSQLQEGLKILEVCNRTENPALRVNVNSLLKKMQKEYNSIVATSESLRRKKKSCHYLVSHKKREFNYPIS